MSTSAAVYGTLIPFGYGLKNITPSIKKIIKKRQVLKVGTESLVRFVVLYTYSSMSSS